MFLRSLAVVLIVASFTSCASRSLAPSVRSFPEQGARPVSHIRGIASYGSALSSIAEVFQRELSLSPSRATVEFYAGDKAMQAALEAIGYDPAFARDAGSRLHAVAAHRRIFVNDARLAGQSWSSRVATLAHELVHCAEFEWAGGRRGTSEQWLREGFAEWAAIRVTEELGAAEPGATLRNMRAQVKAAPSPVRTLGDMSTFKQWAALAIRHDTVVYAQATVAVDRLVTLHGVPAVIDYFRRFATGDDAHRNFREAFGRERSAFESEIAREAGFR